MGLEFAERSNRLLEAAKRHGLVIASYLPEGEENSPPEERLRYTIGVWVEQDPETRPERPGAAMRHPLTISHPRLANATMEQAEMWVDGFTARGELL